MGFLHWFEWMALLIVNGAICFAYWSIPAKLKRARGDDHAALSPGNTDLFARFIQACGSGHLVMVFVMLVLAGVHENAFGDLWQIWCRDVRNTRAPWITFLIWAWIFYDARTACISIDAAKRLKVVI
ncbi:MAG: hypothetical protein AAFY19_00345 [Pseudomonadota bacterium]